MTHREYTEEEEERIRKEAEAICDAQWHDKDRKPWITYRQAVEYTIDLIKEDIEYRELKNSNPF